MNIYLAASYKAQERMRDIRDQLEVTGEHKVTSRWIDQPGNERTIVNGVVVDRIQAARHAKQDREDIDHADLVAFFTEWTSSTGGLHWEYGYSIGTVKHVVLVGPMVSVFFALPHWLERFDKPVEFVKWVLS